MPKTQINLNEFAGGALAEKFNFEMQRVLENIADPNTDHKKKRKIQINLTLESNEKRNLTNVLVDIKSTLAPSKGVETQIMVDYSPNGVVGAELKSGIPGQTYFDGEGVKTDTGEPVEEVEKQSSKIVQFK